MCRIPPLPLLFALLSFTSDMGNFRYRYYFLNSELNYVELLSKIHLCLVT